MPNIRVDMSRPWDDDDPAEYAQLPADSPHDRGACVACQHWSYWDPPQSRDEAPHDHQGRVVAGWWLMDSHDVLAENYPERFSAILRHRAEVARSAREAREEGRSARRAPDTDSAAAFIEALGEDPDDPIDRRHDPFAEYGDFEPPPEAGDNAVIMRDGHNAMRCWQCFAYATWVWPFTTMERWRNGKRDAEKEWLKTATEGYRIAPFVPGAFAESITPDRGDLEHVLSTLPEGMTTAQWVEELQVVGAPTPWDDVPEEVAFWRDYDRRWRQRDEWVAEHGWNGPRWGRWPTTETP